MLGGIDKVSMIVTKNTNLPILATIERYAPRRWKRTNNPKSSFMMPCPLPEHNDAEHPDHSGSFAVNAEGTVFHCFGCGEAGNHYQLYQLLSGNDGRQPPIRRPEPPRRRNTTPHHEGQYTKFQGATIHDIAVTKRLDEDYLKDDLAWVDTTLYGRPAIMIPYFSEHKDYVQT
jgi:hypothetical protein